MRWLLPASALFVLLSTAACSTSGGGSGGSPAPDNLPRARIENRSSLDMDIYVRRSDRQSSRLGFVPASDTASFPLPRAMTAGATTISFEARPARAGGEPVVSEPFATSGEEIFWSIPPQ